MRPVALTTRLVLAQVLVLGLIGCGKINPRLPYDNSNPVLYDNDEVVDVYTDAYLLALSSLGEIQLKGFITSSSIAPENRFVPPESYERMVNDRQAVIAAAKASGFKNLPSAVRGPKRQLRKP